MYNVYADNYNNNNNNNNNNYYYYYFTLPLAVKNQRLKTEV